MNRNRHPLVQETLLIKVHAAKYKLNEAAQNQLKLSKATLRCMQSCFEVRRNGEFHQISWTAKNFRP